MAVFSRKPAVSLKRGKIGIRLITNRKLHVHFQLVLKSTTLDDLKWSLATVQHACVCRSPPQNCEWR